MSEKILLIDGHSILNRAFYGLPELTNAEGLHTNAIYGFLNILFRIVEEEKPDYLTVAFDLHAPTFRHKMYADYKGTRKGMPQELREQVPVMKDVLMAMGITIVAKEGYEADDLLGTLAKKSEARGMDVTVLSGDRDLLQLASKHICIRIPKTRFGKTTIEDYFEENVKEKYQLTPAQIIELKALMGDSSDNIPGLPGVGEKTATKILLEYGTVENAWKHVEELKPNKAKNAFLEHYDMAILSKKLATINIDSPIEYDWESARIGEFYTKEAYEYLIRVARQPKKHVLTDVLLETMSIIAYKQPVTKIEIEKIRGVKSDHAVNKLVEYGLAEEVGRLDAPGRPILFGTTEEFLRRFCVQSLDELPMLNTDQIEQFKEEAEDEAELKLNL